MQEVQVETLQTLLNSFANKDVYIHLETTNGSYAAHYDEQFLMQVLLFVMLKLIMNLLRL